MGSTYDSFTRSSANAANEIFVLGGLYDYNCAGHIAKFTSKGNPVWSYTYKLDYFDFIKLIFFKKINFSDMLLLSDGSMLVSGNVEQVLSPYGLPPPVKNWGLLSKLDRFGKVLWTKMLANEGNLSITDIYQTSDGDIIGYIATDNGQKRTLGDHSYGKVFRMGPNGNIKWSSLLYSALFDAGGLGVKNKRAIMQSKSKNIIIGDVVHKTGDVFVETKEGNLHFMELDYATGKVNWESSYEYPVPVYDRFFLPDLLQPIELTGGGFSFSTSLYLASAGNTLVKKPVVINTDNKGVIQKLSAFVSADGSSSRIMQAVLDKNTMNRSILIENGGKPYILEINESGQIIWQHGYNTNQGQFPANSFSAGPKGFNLFMSNNRSKQYRLLITDATGAIDCMNEDAAFTTVPAVLNLSHDSVHTRTDYNIENYYDYAYPLKRDEDYPLAKTTECQQTLDCCTDFVDQVNIPEIHICEGKDYSLPDGTIIKDSGVYDITYKTALGCDSIKFYKIVLDKNTASLDLGADTCLNGGNSFTLTATKGFGKYYWMNSSIATGNTFKVTQPGEYFVRVENSCGSRTDSIGIFELCDYPLYMPKAFTPNADGLNDVFRVSPVNKNKMMRLAVYNRYGELLFQTRNSNEGWNGRYKHQEAEGGVYIYFLEMRGLSGHLLTQKGTVLLVR